MTVELSADFFDGVRPIFGNKLTSGQVDGLTRIVTYAYEQGYSITETAFMLGQIKHETADWMWPIREGARRFGPNYTDQQSIRAVTQIYNKGIIKTNYALPAGPYKQSYYGRGLIQITWYDNYRKFSILLDKPELVSQPDLALDWKISLDIAFIGCRDGVFTGKSMSDYKFPQDFAAARAIVNGDVKKNGELCAKYSRAFLEALKKTGYPAHAEEVSTPDSKTDKQVYRELQTELKALKLYTGKIDGIWGKGSQSALDKWQEHSNTISTLLGEL